MSEVLGFHPWHRKPNLNRKSSQFPSTYHLTIEIKGFDEFLYHFKRNDPIFPFLASWPLLYL
jgi:hypothetical protein